MALLAAGLENDCPFSKSQSGDPKDDVVLDAASVQNVDDGEFTEYTGRINVYLQAGLLHASLILAH